MGQNDILDIERRFLLSCDVLWSALTDRDVVSKWYGPGAETIMHEYELYVGGQWRCEMRWGVRSMFSIMTFNEINAPNILSYDHHSCDQNWKIGANPMMPNWPKVVRIMFHLTPISKNETIVTIKQEPINATDQEKETFTQMAPAIAAGWQSGFDIINKITQG